MKLSVTKMFTFCYGHSLPGYSGLCKNFHGHNATLEVEVGLNIPIEEVNTFSVDAQYMGMVSDFGKMKQMVGDMVIKRLDHQYLNEIMPNAYLPATAENLVRWIWHTLVDYYGHSLLRIRLYETPTSYAELKKED